MAEFTINDFRGKVRDLARPNRFLVTLEGTPSDVALPNDYIYFVKGIGTPTKTIGEIGNLFWFGGQYKIGGDPTFDDITLTFLNKDKYDIISAFETWMELIASTETNERGEPDDYKAKLVIKQLKIDNSGTAQYVCQGVYPKTISPVELSHETNDSVEEFQVTFSIDYWTGEEGEATSGVVKNDSVSV